MATAVRKKEKKTAPHHEAQELFFAYAFYSSAPDCNTANN
jgi:hypothetical protein